METSRLGVKQQLFADRELHTYAVLDGASISGLLPKLNEHHPESVCLYRGELQPDLAECAPYLVRLEESAEFTDWVLTEGWGQHWGIFALAPANLTQMRKHFRTFLIVKTPEDKRVYFRYYDPRVLRVYLPTCHPEETRTIFGPIVAYFCEHEQPSNLLAFRIEDGVPKRELIPLAPSRT
ncbi:MAG: DUF4123 domain-containing protein [Verrucomicrobiota bacterium]